MMVHALVREPGSWFSVAACGAVGAAARGDRYIYWPEEGAEKVTCQGCAAALAALALEASGSQPVIHVGAPRRDRLSMLNSTHVLCDAPWKDLPAGDRVLTDEFPGFLTVASAQVTCEGCRAEMTRLALESSEEH